MNGSEHFGTMSKSRSQYIIILQHGKAVQTEKLPRKFKDHSQSQLKFFSFYIWWPLSVCSLTSMMLDPQRWTSSLCVFMFLITAAQQKLWRILGEKVRPWITQYKLACADLKLFVFHLRTQSEISWALGAIKGFYYVAQVVHNTL